MNSFICLVLIFTCLVESTLGQKNLTRILGTVEVSKTSSIDATEVTIQEYVYFIINNDFNPRYFPNSQAISPATNQFFNVLRLQDFQSINLSANDKNVALNYGEKGFTLTDKLQKSLAQDSSNFSIYNPVVGISFQQAQQFCKWREDLVNKSKAVKVRITLPPIEIYKKLNSNKDSVYNSFKGDSCNRYQFNYTHEKCFSLRKTKHLVTEGKELVRVDSYLPSKLKIYNIQGNAAEMTSTQGIATGGSFRHFANESFHNKVQNYNKEENWLGFRCFVTLYR